MAANEFQQQDSIFWLQKDSMLESFQPRDICHRRGLQPNRRCTNTTYFVHFLKNLKKLKKFWTIGGSAPLGPPLDVSGNGNTKYEKELSQYLCSLTQLKIKEFISVEDPGFPRWGRQPKGIG